MQEELEEPTVLVFCGSWGREDEIGRTINDPGPLCEDQLPAWYWNPWGYDMEHFQYPGSKYQQAQNALNVNIGGSTILVCYSAGSEACLIYARERVGQGYEVPTMILMGPTFSGSDNEGGTLTRAGSWMDTMSFLLENGTNITVIDDGRFQNTAGDMIAARYDPPAGASGFYEVVSVLPFKHQDEGGWVSTGINNSQYASTRIYVCATLPSQC